MTMLRHIILFRLYPQSSAEAKARLQQEILERFGELPSKIAAIKAFSAGADVVQKEGSWDVGAVIDFDNEASLGEYAVHPSHQEFVRYITPLRQERASLDFWL